MSDTPGQPTPAGGSQRRSEPRPKRFMGIEMTWTFSAPPGSDLPRKARRYIFNAALSGGLRRNVVLELQDHFRAALADGRSVDETIKALGKPGELGRKLGRASSPIRWFVARLNIWMGRVMLALVIAYFTLWGCLRWAKPVPGVDYYAQLNEQTITTPKESHAWPLYRQALMDGRMHHRVIHETLAVLPYGVDDQPVQPGDANWPAAKGYLTDVQPLLKLLREGAEKPNLGCTFLPLHKLPEEDRRALADVVPPASVPDDQDDVSRLVADQFDEDALKQIPVLRIAMLTILADMNLAAEQSDVSRVLANFQTLLRTCHQINQVPLSTARYQALTLYRAAIGRITQLSLAYPKLFTDSALGDIRRVIAQESAYWDTLGPPKNLMLLDRIQRSYTGGPDGRITFTGVAYLWRALAPKVDSTPPPPAFVAGFQRELHFPVNYLVFPSAQTLLAEQAEADARYYMESATPWTRASGWIPLPQSRGMFSSLVQFTHEYPRLLVQLERWRYFPGHFLANAKAEVKQNDALLAVAQYHARHGRYPDSFQSLVGEFLSALPNASVGDPLLIKLTPRGPIIYSVGRNGIDEGGLYVPFDSSRSDKNADPPPGDDIHYPSNARRIWTTEAGKEE